MNLITRRLKRIILRIELEYPRKGILAHRSEYTKGEGSGKEPTKKRAGRDVGHLDLMEQKTLYII